MASLRRVVLDVLKPNDPSLLVFTERLADLEGVEGATATLVELDQEVQNVEVTVEGASLEYAAIEEAIENLGGSIHSVDQVSFGTHLVGNERRRRDD